MDLSDASVLVTGGAGFIGSHLVEALVARGGEVTVVDDLRHGRLDNLAGCRGSVRFVDADVLAPEAQDLVAEGRFDLVYHLASNAYVPPSVADPANDLRLNLLSTFRLLETLRLHSPDSVLVYFSSAAVYGSPERMPVDETAQLAPISPYGVSKLAAERYVAVYALLYGLKAASLRLFSVYGPRQTKQVVYDLIRKLHDDPTELPMHGDGSQVRDFCYVEDVVSAALAVVASGRLEGEVYNVASGEGCSILELAEMICRAMGVAPHFAFSGSVRPGDAEKWVADLGRLRSIGFSPQTDLREGIARTLEWYRRSFPSGGEERPGRSEATGAEGGSRIDGR